MNEILTATEAAEFLKKHPDTIRHWLETGKLKARKLAAGKNGIWVILRSDLLELAVSADLNKRRRIKKTPASPVLQTSLPM